MYFNSVNLIIKNGYSYDLFFTFCRNYVNKSVFIQYLTKLGKLLNFSSRVSYKVTRCYNYITSYCPALEMSKSLRGFLFEDLLQNLNLNSSQPSFVYNNVIKTFRMYNRRIYPIVTSAQ